jgi:hypothetical protein
MVSCQLHAPAAMPPGKIPWYQLDRRLGGLHSRSGRGGEEKNSQPLPGLKPPIVQPVAQGYTTGISRLLVYITVPDVTRLQATNCFFLYQYYSGHCPLSEFTTLQGLSLLPSSGGRCHYIDTYFILRLVAVTGIEIGTF